MDKKQQKLIVNYLRIGGYWRDMINKKLTFLHKATVTLICCNLCIFIVFIPVLDT